MALSVTCIFKKLSMREEGQGREGGEGLESMLLGSLRVAHAVSCSKRHGGQAGRERERERERDRDLRERQREIPKSAPRALCLEAPRS